MSAQKMTVIKTRDGKVRNVKEYLVESTCDTFGVAIETVGGSPIHCESGPAIVTSDGKELYYCDGQRLTYEQYCERVKIEPHYHYLPNGALQRIWKSRQTRKPHRTDGPAVETSDGSYTAWMINGTLHRVGGPAVIASNKSTTEEMFYYNGKLHNPDGPAKINHLTNRTSYYLNGKRLSKAEFMSKQKTRSKMREVVARRTAYKAYIDAWRIFRSIISSKAYERGTSLQVIELLNDLASLKHGYERRAAAIGIYHALAGDAMTTDDFSAIHGSLQEEGSSLYVMDAGDVDIPYELYLATFGIHKCDPSACFTMMSPEKDSVDILSSAIEDSGRLDLPMEYKEFSSPQQDKVEPEVKESDGPEGIFSWTLPLALAAGVGMLSKMYKTKKVVQKKSLEEKECLIPQRKR